MNTLGENHGKENQVEIPDCALGLDKPMIHWFESNVICGVVISGYSFSLNSYSAATYLRKTVKILVFQGEKIGKLFVLLVMNDRFFCNKFKIIQPDFNIDKSIIWSNQSWLGRN